MSASRQSPRTIRHLPNSPACRGSRATSTGWCRRPGRHDVGRGREQRSMAESARMAPWRAAPARWRRRVAGPFTTDFPVTARCSSERRALEVPTGAAIDGTTQAGSPAAKHVMRRRPLRRSDLSTASAQPGGRQTGSDNSNGFRVDGRRRSRLRLTGRRVGESRPPPHRTNPRNAPSALDRARAGNPAALMQLTQDVGRRTIVTDPSGTCSLAELLHLEALEPL